MLLPSPPADGKRFRILLVEDDNFISHLVLIHLHKTGFDARLASDGNAGWQAFKTIAPHMVITDVGMPGLNGWQLASKIRQESGVPIIILTAADTGDDEVHSLKVGADDYVSKPFQPAVLLARVVANLRRAYRYDHQDPSPAQAPPPRHTERAEIPVDTSCTPSPETPEGWTHCEACGYLGPEFKFDTTDPEDGRINMCPNCHNRNLSYPVG